MLQGYHDNPEQQLAAKESDNPEPSTIAPNKRRSHYDTCIPVLRNAQPTKRVTGKKRGESIFGFIKDFKILCIIIV